MKLQKCLLKLCSKLFFYCYVYFFMVLLDYVIDRRFVMFGLFKNKKNKVEYGEPTLVEILKEIDKIDGRDLEELDREFEKKYGVYISDNFISRDVAIDIALSKLKHEYFERKMPMHLSYFVIKDYDVEIVKYNKNYYWYIRANNADASWMESNGRRTTFSDGFIDFDDLSCLIDMITGEYIYYGK